MKESCTNPATLVSRPLCRHCGKKPANRPRQCCWHCYYSPGVRDRYEPKGDPKLTRKGVGVVRISKPAAYATTAEPGSEEKIVVLEERASQGEDLWHSEDSTGDDESEVIGMSRQRGTRQLERHSAIRADLHQFMTDGVGGSKGEELRPGRD